MAGIKYRGFIITPNSKQLPETGEWSINVLIKKHHESESVVCPYSLEQTLPTKREAERTSCRLGMDIINGRVPGCSVAVLI